MTKPKGSISLFVCFKKSSRCTCQFGNPLTSAPVKIEHDGGDEEAILWLRFLALRGHGSNNSPVVFKRIDTFTLQSLVLHVFLRKAASRSSCDPKSRATFRECSEDMYEAWASIAGSILFACCCISCSRITAYRTPCRFL